MRTILSILFISFGLTCAIFAMLPSVDELPSIPCPNEGGEDSLFCLYDDCKALHKYLHPYREVMISDNYPTTTLELGIDYTLKNHIIMQPSGRDWWQIRKNTYWTLVDHEGLEWLMVYPDKKDDYTRDSHIEVHAEPIVTKMKDGWYKITFETEDD
jgi:hypothetical protein